MGAAHADTRLHFRCASIFEVIPPADAGVLGGIMHFGFRLTRPEDIDAAVAAVEGAGGTVTSRGEFGPGLPYAFVRDPDGYEIEIWFE